MMDYPDKTEQRVIEGPLCSQGFMLFFDSAHVPTSGDIHTQTIKQ